MIPPVVLVVGSGQAALEATREVVAQGGRAVLVRSGSAPRQCSLRTPGGFEVINGGLLEVEGSPGRFRARVSSDGEETILECSAVVLAPGPHDRPAAPAMVSLDELEERDVPDDLGSAAFVLRPGSPRPAFIKAVRAARGLRSGPSRPKVTIFSGEMAAYGLDEIIYRHAQAEGVLFIRSADAEVTVRPPLVAARDLVTGEDVALTPDLLVVVEAENGDGAVRVPPGGFAVEKGSPSMGEASTVREGVTSPGREDDLLDGEAIIGARAAATRAMTIALSPPDRAPQAVIVDRDRCSACLTCARVCPFGAARPSEEGKASIDGALCQACGICVGACPGRALSLPNYCGVAGGGSMLMEDRQ